MQSSALRRLLVIDPCSDLQPLLSELSRSGWKVHECPLSRALEYPADVGIIQLGDCLDTVRELLARNPAQWIALLPDHLHLNEAVGKFIGEWFFDYHTLPLDLHRLKTILGHASGMARLRHGDPHHAPQGDLVGDSRAMREQRRLIAKLASTDSPVLIRGESGTGKELVAQALHRQSRRAGQPFIAINCGAIPEQLIQSELFGHEKGAFTGASQRKTGRIEAADGGTLFLDEIGDLPLELQANLLRFLQEGQIQRIGCNTPIAVDVRVLAATHVDLEQAVVARRFREDLYYRLNVLQIRTAPLRERLEDIPLLVRHFAQLYASEVGRRPREPSPAALQAMQEYAWPGNIRELANRVRRGMVLAEGRFIEPEDLGLLASCQESGECNLVDYKLQAERRALNEAIQYTSTFTQAAKALGVSRPTFYRLLNKHGMRTRHKSPPL